MTIFAIQPGLQTLPFVSVCGEAKPPASKQLVNPPAIPRPATIPMISQTFMIGSLEHDSENVRCDYASDVKVSRGARRMSRTIALEFNWIRAFACSRKFL